MSTNYILPQVKFVDKVNGFQIMRKLEACARTCYQSEDKQHTKPTADFLRGIIKSGHTSVLEHESITVDIITSRDVLAEWTRHRIGVAYSVESTRYVNYKEGVNFIIPPEYDPHAKLTDSEVETRTNIFKEACDTAAYAYAQMIKHGAKPQEARAVLPQALKVNMKVTMNIRAWRHFFELRCAPSAHPNIKEIAIAILLEFRKKMLPLFEDIKYDEDFYENHKTRIDNIVIDPKKVGINYNELEKDIEKFNKAEDDKRKKMTAAMDIDDNVRKEDIKKTSDTPYMDTINKRRENGEIVTRQEVANAQLLDGIIDVLERASERYEERRQAFAQMQARMACNPYLQIRPDCDIDLETLRKKLGGL